MAQLLRKRKEKNEKFTTTTINDNNRQTSIKIALNLTTEKVPPMTMLDHRSLFVYGADQTVP